MQVLKLLVSFVILVNCAFSTATSSAQRFDTQIRPIVISPTSSSMNQGDAIGFTVNFDRSAASSTTVYYSSSNTSLINVPSSQVLSTSSSSLSFIVPPWKPIKSALKRSTVVHVTASCNGTTVGCDVTVY